MEDGGGADKAAAAASQSAALATEIQPESGNVIIGLLDVFEG